MSKKTNVSLTTDQLEALDKALRYFVHSKFHTKAYKRDQKIAERLWRKLCPRK